MGRQNETSKEGNKIEPEAEVKVEAEATPETQVQDEAESGRGPVSRRELKHVAVLWRERRRRGRAKRFASIARRVWRRRSRGIRFFAGQHWCVCQFCGRRWRQYWRKRERGCQCQRACQRKHSIGDQRGETGTQGKENVSTTSSADGLVSLSWGSMDGALLGLGGGIDEMPGMGLESVGSPGNSDSGSGAVTVSLSRISAGAPDRVADAV